MTYTLELPFEGHGLPGLVRVRIHPNRDPRQTWHDRIAANFDQAAFTGFPVMTAEVEHPAEGPRAWFTWVQTICHIRDGQVIDQTLDTPPWLVGPWYVIGHRPTLSDSPSNPDHLHLDWVARSYLVDVESGEPTWRATPVVGFVWGYRRHDEHTPTELLTPRPATAADWHQVATLLSHYPPA